MSDEFDPAESLTHEEILLRFERVLGRKMTPEEKRVFFLPYLPVESDPEE